MVKTFNATNFNDIGKLNAVGSLRFLEKSPIALNLVHPGAHNTTV
jgi:hypothetical protein